MIAPKTATTRVSLDDLYGEETANWMRLTPQERWAETVRLAAWFHALGGTSDPDPDTGGVVTGAAHTVRTIRCAVI